ncbi:MAG: RNA polymerase sigma factor [Clostridia bacterium]|nr:sigma-70 family RNA polymerase sigma factor [Clostridium sp.]
MLGYVYIIIKNSGYLFSNEDVEEIASDVFLTIWKNKEKLDINKEISPYIAGITKNLLRKKKRDIKNINENIKNIDELQNYLSDKIDYTHNEAEEQEKIDIVTEELTKMKKEDKNIFTYYYYESKNIKEIANILGITEIKAKSRLSRIRKKLRKELEKRGYSYGRK